MQQAWHDALRRGIEDCELKGSSISRPLEPRALVPLPYFALLSYNFSAIPKCKVVHAQIHIEKKEAVDDKGDSKKDNYDPRPLILD